MAMMQLLSAAETRGSNGSITRALRDLLSLTHSTAQPSTTAILSASTRTKLCCLLGRVREREQKRPDLSCKGSVGPSRTAGSRGPCLARGVQHAVGGEHRCRALVSDSFVQSVQILEHSECSIFSFRMAHGQATDKRRHGIATARLSPSVYGDTSWCRVISPAGAL